MSLTLSFIMSTAPHTRQEGRMCITGFIADQIQAIALHTKPSRGASVMRETGPLQLKVNSHSSQLPNGSHSVFTQSSSKYTNALFQHPYSWLALRLLTEMRQPAQVAYALGLRQARGKPYQTFHHNYLIRLFTNIRPR